MHPRMFNLLLKLATNKKPAAEEVYPDSEIHRIAEMLAGHILGPVTVTREQWKERVKQCYSAAKHTVTLLRNAYNKGKS